MKRPNSTEIAGLLLAGIFFVVGLRALIWPERVAVYHPSKGRPGVPDVYFSATLTMNGSRVYGALAMLTGVGLATLAIGWRQD